MITIAGYRIDAALTEGHKFPSEATQYPREAGSTVTDHVINNPIEVTIEGVVSDTPIGAIKAVRDSAQATGDDALEFLPSDEALAKLLAIRAAREPVIIETSLKVFEQMVMTDLDIPRDADTGHALRFTATFEQAEIVTNLRTTVQVAKPVAKGNRPPIGVKFGFDPRTAQSISGRDIAWNPSKGRFEYANSAGQPGGTPVPNSDLATVQPVDSLRAPNGDPMHFNHQTNQWETPDGKAVSQDLDARRRTEEQTRAALPWWQGGGAD